MLRLRNKERLGKDWNKVSVVNGSIAHHECCSDDWSKGINVPDKYKEENHKCDQD